MILQLDDTGLASRFYPFSATRHVTDMRIGILTIREKWQQQTGSRAAVTITAGETAVAIPANWLPQAGAVDFLLNGGNPAEMPERGLVTVVEHAADIIRNNAAAIEADIELLLSQRQWSALPAAVTAVCPERILIEAGAKLEHCYINASAGPVYIAKGAEIMAGSYLRGPLAVCEGALVKMGAHIYGATTIGPYCLAGGEIKNSILTAYSNKAHHGYLGDSVIGEWCNLGAGTSNSNIKNTAGPVMVQLEHETVNAGIKSGLLMGDYSRSAINTSFTTGAVVGVSCNVFGGGLTPKFIPHFSWGTAGERYLPEKALQDIDNWKQLKGHAVTEDEKKRLIRLYNGETG